MAERAAQSEEPSLEGNGPANALQERPVKGSRLQLLALGIGIFAVALAALALAGYIRLNKKIDQEISNVDWRLEVDQQSEFLDPISLDVGVIQFLKRGYSIQLNDV